MISISDFKSNIKNLAKSNRFIVDFDVDPLLTPFKSDFFEELRYLVQDAVIPNRTQTPVTIKYHGMSLDLPGDYGHGELLLKFLNNTNWKARTFFEMWMDNIQDIGEHADNTRLDSQDILNDLNSITVKQIVYNENDISAKYKFFNVVPKEIGEIRLSMDGDQFETFTVSFTYTRWVQEP